MTLGISIELHFLGDYGLDNEFGMCGVLYEDVVSAHLVGVNIWAIHGIAIIIGITWRCRWCGVG